LVETYHLAVQDFWRTIGMIDEVGTGLSVDILVEGLSQVFNGFDYNNQNFISKQFILT
jgi:hypothetical protein